MARSLPPHPLPPSDFRERPIPLKKAARPLFRIHLEAHDPLHFGRSGRNRFDDPKRAFGVLYASLDSRGAFIETAANRPGHHEISSRWLETREISRLTPSRPLRLVDLGSSGLARIGADARLTAGDHGVAQRWSRAFWAHPGKPDGVYYRARHDPSRFSVALYDRSRKALRVTRLGTLDDPSLKGEIAEILNHYDFGLLP